MNLVKSATKTGILISLNNIRHAYFRGEKVPLKFKVTNHSVKSIDDVQLSIDIAGVVTKCINIKKIEKDTWVECLFTVDSLSIKAGKYDVNCELKARNTVTEKQKFTIWIARKWNPQRMRVWLWPHTAYAETVCKLDDTAIERLKWWQDKGWNSINIWTGESDNYFDVLDYGIVNGLEMGLSAHGGFRTINADMISTKKEIWENFDDNEKMKWVKGKQDEYIKNPFCPETANEQEQKNAEMAKKFQDFPGWKLNFFNSEIEVRLKNLKTTEVKQLIQANCNDSTKHELIAPGVIKDVDEKYVEGENGLYRYKWGDGLTTVNARAANTIHKYRSDVLCFTDPFRTAAIYDRFSSLDIVSTWTYTNPDPKLMLFVENLITTARPSKQKVMQTVTLLNYPGTIAPSEKGWTLMGPDRAVETNWINLSRRPDGLGIYVSSDTDPFMENNESFNDFQKSPKTYDALKKFTNEIVKPYGSMITNLDRTSRKVAILNSFSSRTLNASPELQGHYPNNQILHFLSVLNMAHIPTDVIFDETIQRYGLEKYDTLVLAKCDTLLETVYNEILAFQKRGGLVIADQYLRAEIPGVIKFDFDFTYRKKINADAIANGKIMADWHDRIDVETAKMEKTEGVTALRDQEIMESYATKLRLDLQDKIQREVDCSSPTALLNMLEKDGVKYLFVINDKRTYGERLGKWKAMLEKAVPQVVTITLNDWNYPNLYAYDLLEKKLLKCNKALDTYQFDVKLPAPGGKIIALYPELFDKVNIYVPHTMNKGMKYKIKINVINSSGDFLSGVQPLKIEIKDPKGNSSEFSDYYAAKNGFLSIDFIPGLNDISGNWSIEVEELTAGITANKKFIL
jgi:hypothetical protein